MTKKIRTPAELKEAVRRLQEEAAKAEKEIIYKVGKLAQQYYHKDGFANMEDFKREIKKLLDQINGGHEL